MFEKNNYANILGMLETLEIPEKEFLCYSVKEIKDKLKVNMRVAEAIFNLISEINMNRQDYDHINDSIKSISNKQEEKI